MEYTKFWRNGGGIQTTKPGPKKGKWRASQGPPREGFIRGKVGLVPAKASLSSLDNDPSEVGR